MSLAAFPRGAVPEVGFNRLNQHYRSVVALARLVLRHGAFEAGRGKVRASSFLMDMNQVFQELVTVALRETLGVSERVFGEHSIGWLDREGRVPLRPDLTWRDGSRCRFVGDVKYKRIDTGVPNGRPVSVARLRDCVESSGWACSSTRRATESPQRTRCAIPGNGWRLPRSTCPAPWRGHWRGLETWRNG